ncbi:MAG: hypothetical protein QOF26_2911 [Baekduia sp.]|jgi:hypothetical protein|nr:hypothetical protein [Baekduia sp.]
MSRTTPLGSLVVVALLAFAVPAGAATPGWRAVDRLPHALPAAGAARAASQAATTDWLVGARPAPAGARLARRFGARSLLLPGAYAVAAPDARAFAAALRRRGLLRFSEPDVPLVRQSAYEGDGVDQTWTRGTVVAAGLAPPAAFAPIGIVDDVVDTRVADVAQARVVAKSPAQALDETGGREVAHGTEVASVAAGRADGAGVIGIAPGAPLLSYGYKSLSCAEVADGILSLADAGAKVINLSFSSLEDCHVLQLATASAFGSGAVVVAAAGNERQHDDPTIYPAAYPHVLGVGALDLGLTPASESSTGATLDLAAPGAAVPVAVPVGLDDDGTADGVTRNDGTSFAAPIVSGVASWLIAARPRLTPGQYGAILRASAKDVGSPGWDARTGFGLVDLGAALQAPVPAADRTEPDDGIDFVDGSAFTTPDPYIFKGAAARTVKASVDPGDDPADVFRIRLAAHGRAAATLTPAAGTNADLRAYSGRAKSLAATPLRTSKLPAGRIDRVQIVNTTNKPATFYVAVTAPGAQTRPGGVPYALKLARG